ncbi:UNVERIFIED_CONTAM: hypothetical protein K2H54_015663 [Gekko kuhli]
MVTYYAARGLHHLYGFAARCRAFLVALAATEFPVMGQLVGCMMLCRFDKNKMVAYCAARGLHHLYGFAARCRATEFPVMGQLVGCMTLCCFDKNKMVTYCAARGLHHLYGFAAQFRTFLVALAATEFPVMGQLVGCMTLCRFDKNKMVAYCAARGLHHLYGFAARCRARAKPLLVSIYSSAATLWGMLASWSCHAEEVLHHLMACLQGQPQKPLLSEEEIATLRLASPARLSTKELQHVVGHVMSFLRGHDEHQAITAMIIFAEVNLPVKELLRRTVIPVTQEVMRHLTAQLRSPNDDLKSLELDGMLSVADKPEQVWKLLPLLPEAVGSLRESDCPKTRRLFIQLQRCLEDVTSPALAADVAGYVLPLFDAESYVARHFAIHNFRAMLGRGTMKALRDLALCSLVPLLVHLYDESSIACWEIPPETTILLGRRKLHRLVLSCDKWSTSRIFGKQFRKVAACSFQEQILGHLRSPQVSVREAAIRILALWGMWSDEQESIQSCAVLTTYALEALHEEDPPGWSLRERLRRLCGACCSSA